MFRRIRKTRKKNEKGGAEAPPPLLAMVGPSVFRSIRKTRKKNEKGGAKAPPLLVKLLRPPMPKNTRRRRRRMGACLPWSSRWNSHNFKCSCSSSKLSRLVALKVMLQGLQEFHLLNIPSSKLSKLTLNRKPKC